MAFFQSLTIKTIQLYQLAFRAVIATVLYSVFGFSSSCRFSETCSEYTLRQVKEHGTINGLKKGLKRLASCWGSPTH